MALPNVLSFACLSNCFHFNRTVYSCSTNYSLKLIKQFVFHSCSRTVSGNFSKHSFLILDFQQHFPCSSYFPEIFPYVPVSFMVVSAFICRTTSLLNQEIKFQQEKFERKCISSRWVNTVKCDGDKMKLKFQVGSKSFWGRLSLGNTNN